MKKILSFIAISLLFVTMGLSQTTLFADDFEGFTAGDYVSTSSDWATWSGDTGTSEDAQISTDQNNTVSGTNSLHIVNGSDIIYYFGDKTSGSYQVKFWYYIATGDGGYFNIEHSFGTNWALSVAMPNGGNGSLTYDNPTQTVNFTFPHDTWFQFVMDIDIDNDEISLNVNGTDVATWQFSLSESSGGAMNVLDCIDFYGPADQSPYYVDDFEFIEISSGVEPAELDLSALSFITDGSASQTLTLTNSGAEDLNFETAISYNFAKQSNVIIDNNSFNNNTKTVALMIPSVKKYNKPITYDINSKDGNLAYFDGTVATSLGWVGTGTTDAEVATLFKYDFLKDYIGMDLTQVIVFNSALPVSGSTNVKVYEGRDGYTAGPMNLLATEGFTAVENDQVIVPITSPIKVTGKDMFVAWNFTQPNGEYCAAMDEVLTSGVNWTKTGPAWNELVNTDYGDFGLIALLTGNASHKWLSLDTYSGTIAPAANQAIQLNFDLTGMANGTYTANLIVKTNDNDDNESYNEIPVTLTVSVGIENNSSIGIMIYPNPSNDFLNVSANENIINISAVNIAGKTVLNSNINAKSYKVDLSDLAKGVYMFNITTENNTATKKVIIK